MNRLRWRLARWLIGPFVTLPDRDGVWVVTREDGGLAIIEADKFRLKMGVDIPDNAFGDTDTLVAYGAARRWGRFVGTVRG